jgi:hypothetical protein
VGASLQSVGANQPRISTYRWALPPFDQREQVKLVDVVINSRPVEQQLSGHGWTLKKLRQWVANQLGRPVSRNTLRTILTQAGLSWKKCKKLLSKANAARRAEFVAQFQRLYEQMCQGQVRMIYVDESHFHQDLDLGYSWGLVGQPLWRESHSPSLSARLNFKAEQVSVMQANVESSYNRIMNADMAFEQLEATKYSILQQTSTTMLAQANTAPQGILGLFR